MKIQIITLFPSVFEGPFATSMLKKAQDKGLAEINYLDLREFGLGPRRQVDDTPYGGGDGMVLKPEPLFAAVRKAQEADPTAKVVLLTPRGARLRQPLVEKLAEASGLILICAHYEGYDERITALVDYQVSVGDFILTGGEIPAMLLVDAVVRLLPGVLGGESSAANESFSDGQTIEYPQYTRPEEFEGMRVPEVLLSGHHGEVERWRRQQAEEQTKRLTEAS